MKFIPGTWDEPVLDPAGIVSAPRRPPDRPGELTLESRVTPRLGKVAERVVVGPPGPERLGPRERIVAVGSDRRRVEPQQYLDTRPRVLSKGVELLDNRKWRSEPLSCGV